MFFALRRVFSAADASYVRVQDVVREFSGADSFENRVAKMEKKSSDCTCSAFIFAQYAPLHSGAIPGKRRWKRQRKQMCATDRTDFCGIDKCGKNIYKNLSTVLDVRAENQ